MDAYHSDDKNIKQFISYCNKPHEDDLTINPYPLLHQISRGHFIVKKQLYNDKMWLAIINRAIELQKAKFKFKLEIEVFYLEKC